MNIHTNKKWSINEQTPDKVAALAGNLNTSLIFAQILLNRKLDSVFSAQSFLSPHINELAEAGKLPDSDKAVERIYQAIKKKEKIYIHGDYDVDGITGTLVMTLFLRELGANAIPFLPHRINDGYGVSENFVDARLIPEKADLLITVDCGSADHASLAKAAKAGIDVIITDHHKLSDDLPQAYAIVNPSAQADETGIENLAGVGVVFMLIIELRKHLRDKGFFEHQPQPNIKAYTDLVALGTLADMVPLKKLNRLLVLTGLKQLATTPRPGLDAMLKNAKVNPAQMNPEDITFRIIPKLNAAGRMDHADAALKLIASRTHADAAPFIKQLNQLNDWRRKEEQTILDQIETFLTQSPEKLAEDVLLLAHPSWHEGVLGIIAARLTRKYHKPAIVVSFRHGMGKGSARSIPGIDITKAIGNCEQYLKGFGGHSQAAGLSIERNQWNGFKQKLFQTVSALSKDAETPCLKVDAVIAFGQINHRLLDELTSLAPFGTQNPEPIFIARDVVAGRIIPMGDCHARFVLRHLDSHGELLNGVRFNLDSLENLPDHFSEIAFRLRWNHWNGNKTPQALIEDWKPMI